MAPIPRFDYPRLVPGLARIRGGDGRGTAGRVVDDRGALAVAGGRQFGLVDAPRRRNRFGDERSPLITRPSEAESDWCAGVQVLVVHVRHIDRAVAIDGDSFVPLPVPLGGEWPWPLEGGAAIQRSPEHLPLIEFFRSRRSAAPPGHDIHLVSRSDRKGRLPTVGG